MNYPQFNAAKACSQQSGYVSISELQRSLLIGYQEAKNKLLPKSISPVVALFSLK